MNRGGGTSRAEATEAEEAGRGKEVAVNQDGETSTTEATEAEEAGMEEEEEEATIAGEDRGNKIIGGNRSRGSARKADGKGVWTDISKLNTG